MRIGERSCLHTRRGAYIAGRPVVRMITLRKSCTTVQGKESRRRTKMMLNKEKQPADSAASAWLSHAGESGSVQI